MPEQVTSLTPWKLESKRAIKDETGYLRTHNSHARDVIERQIATATPVSSHLCDIAAPSELWSNLRTSNTENDSLPVVANRDLLAGCHSRSHQGTSQDRIETEAVHEHFYAGFRMRLRGARFGKGKVRGGDAPGGW